MNHHPQYNYKALDPDLDEYLSEYKNQTPLESDHYAGELFPLLTRKMKNEKSSPSYPSTKSKLCNQNKLHISTHVRALPIFFDRTFLFIFILLLLMHT